MTELARTRAIKPTDPAVLRLTVLRRELISPSFVRVTVGGDDLVDLPDKGFDQWFRLFAPEEGQPDLTIMKINDGQWYRAWLELPDAIRPICRNYTVRAFRPAQRELDIDFVLHRGPSGKVEGAAAGWASAVEPGQALGLLDQGILFNQPAHLTDVLVVVDDTGVPAAEGIARSLPRDFSGHFVLEVADLADARPLDLPDGVSVDWLARPSTDSGTIGPLARQRAIEIGPTASTYVYVVGEASFATGLRADLMASDVPKDNIDFCSYWRVGRDR